MPQLLLLLQSFQSYSAIKCKNRGCIAASFWWSFLGSGIESGTGHGAFSLSEVFGSSLSGFTLAAPVPSASLAARRPRMRANCLSCAAQRRRTFRRFAVPLAGLAVVLGDLAPARSRSSPSTSQRGMLVLNQLGVLRKLIENSFSSIANDRGFRKRPSEL